MRARLSVVADGRAAQLEELPGAKLQLRPGQGGLQTMRAELRLRAAAGSARSVEVRDATYPGRVGWKAVVAAPGRGTAVRSDVPASDPTNGLRAYPERLLESPSDVREATFSVRPGRGVLEAPDGPRSLPAGDGGGHSFADVFEDAAAGEGVLAFLLLAAFGWGALHALSPGHGKAMVAAYLIGTRGTPKHAVALGATVTITHTIGVFALGFVTLALIAVRPARGPVPMADARLGADGRGHRSRRLATPRARCARTPHSALAITITITSTTSPGVALSAWAPPPGSFHAPRRSWCCWQRSRSTRLASGSC